MQEHTVGVDDLSNDEVEVVKVPMDDKGGVMFIGSLSADDFVEWQEGQKEDKKNAAARLIVRSLVRSLDDPTRVGTEDMVPKFRRAKIAKTERLLRAIFKLNDINQPEKEIEKLKNA